MGSKEASTGPHEYAAGSEGQWRQSRWARALSSALLLQALGQNGFAHEGGDKTVVKTVC